MTPLDSPSFEVDTDKVVNNWETPDWVDLDSIKAQRAHDKKTLTEMEANDPDNCEPVILDTEVLTSVRDIDNWEENWLKHSIRTVEVFRQVDLNCDWEKDTTHISTYNSHIYSRKQD